MWQRKFQQPPVQEKQHDTRRKAAMYLRPRYLFLFHALSADTRQGEELTARIKSMTLASPLKSSSCCMIVMFLS